MSRRALIATGAIALLLGSSTAIAALVRSDLSYKGRIFMGLAAAPTPSLPRSDLASQGQTFTETELTPTIAVIVSPTPRPSATATPRPTATRTPTPIPAPLSTDVGSDGFSVAVAHTGQGDFKVSCVGAPRGSTRVITDSASDSDCRDNCPVLPLADFISRNGGFAGINGMYFCPADYAQCANQKNSFDTLFFNSRHRTYLNSANNIYSVLPWLAIEANGNPLFYSQTSQWGRDTGIQAGTAGNPMLVSGGQNVSGNYALDAKQSATRANRGAFAQRSGNIYLCITGGATVPDSAAALQSLGMENAINIDGGGSSALWYNGRYYFGPGRSIPTAIIFAR